MMRRSVAAVLAGFGILAGIAGCGSSTSGRSVPTSIVGVVNDQTNCANVLDGFSPRDSVDIFFSPTVTADSCARVVLDATGTMVDGAAMADIALNSIVNIQAIRKLPTGVEFTFDMVLASILINGTYTDALAGALDLECQLRAGVRDFVGNSAVANMGCTFFQPGTRTAVCAFNLENGGIRVANLHKIVEANLAARGDCFDF